MKTTRENIGSTEIRFGGFHVKFTVHSFSTKAFLVTITFMLLFTFIIMDLVKAETILSVIKGIGGVILGLMLVIFMRLFFGLFQGYLSKLKEVRKRKNIEEKYDFLKEKIEEQRLYVKRKFKDSDQLDLLQEHLKKLELEELKIEIDKIEELKATHKHLCVIN